MVVVKDEKRVICLYLCLSVYLSLSLSLSSHCKAATCWWRRKPLFLKKLPAWCLAPILRVCHCVPKTCSSFSVLTHFRHKGCIFSSLPMLVLLQGDSLPEMENLHNTTPGEGSQIILRFLYWGWLEASEPIPAAPGLLTMYYPGPVRLNLSA